MLLPEIDVTYKIKINQQCEHNVNRGRLRTKGRKERKSNRTQKRRTYTNNTVYMYHQIGTGCVGCPRAESNVYWYNVKNAHTHIINTDTERLRRTHELWKIRIGFYMHDGYESFTELAV